MPKKKDFSCFLDGGRIRCQSNRRPRQSQYQPRPRWTLEDLKPIITDGIVELPQLDDLNPSIFTYNFYVTR